MCRDLYDEVLTTLFRNIFQNPIEINFRLLTLFPIAVLHFPTRSCKNKRIQSARILNDRLKIGFLENIIFSGLRLSVKLINIRIIKSLQI